MIIVAKPPTEYLDIVRTCDRCGRTFRVPKRQPGRKVCFRHAGNQPSYEHTPKKPAIRESIEAQRKLDRQISLRSAQTELSDLTNRIEEIDDQIVSLRQEKERKVARHLIVSGLVDCLQALLSGTEVEYARELSDEQTPLQSAETVEA